MAYLASILNIPETLFTTNQVPSEEDSKAIEAKLAQLREEHSLLALRLAEIEAKITHLKVIQHPLRYIPDDVLGRIFEYATPWCFEDGTDRDSFPPDPLMLDAPWTLSHVCRNWRAVCLSLPHLWSAFHVLWGEPGTTEWLERLDTLYPRSEPLPLRLCIDYIRQACFPTLLESAHLWRCIRLYFHCDWDPDDDVVLHDCLFPHLTHLALSNLHWKFSMVKAPCLQNLELADASISCGLLLPWEQITRYKSTETDLRFIGRMKNLEEIIIEEDRAYERWRDLDVRNVVSMNGVRYLEYTDTCNDEEARQGSCYTRLFTHYQFTSLRTLVIIDAFPNVKGFTFSLPSVIELSLSFQKPYGIEGILFATPNVQSLHLQSDAGTVWLMKTRWRGASVTYFGQLRRLFFTLTVESRRMNVPALSKAITNLKELYELPLATVSFYSGILDKEETHMPESQWIEKIQQGIAGEVEKWMERGMQVQYHHNVEHRFAK